MPQVPRYDRQVADSGMANVRVSTNAPAEAFGGGQSDAQVSNAFQGLGNTIQQIGMEEKKKADELATTEAYVKLNKAKNTLFYDPNNGAMNRKGRDAFASIGETSESFEKEAQAIEDGLTNGAQKEMFKRIRTKEGGQLNEHLQKHAFAEAQKYDQDVTKQGIESSQNDAVLNFQDPQKIAGSLAIQKDLILSHARRNGLPPDAVKNLLQTEESRTHLGVIKQMLVGGLDREASLYAKTLEGKTDSLTAQDDIAIKGLLKEGTTKGESQRAASAIMQEHGSNMKAALESARSIESPELQEATVREVKLRHMENEKIKRDNEERRFDTAGVFLEKNLKLPDTTVMHGLKMNERQALEKRLEQLTAGTPPSTDWNKHWKLHDMAIDPDKQQEFLSINPMLYRNFLGDTQYNQMLEFRKQIKSGDTKELEDFRSKKQIFDDALAKVGKNIKNHPEFVTDFRNRVSQEMRSYQEETGKKISNEEFEKRTSALMVNVTTDPGMIWDTKKRVFELTPSDVEKGVSLRAKDVPVADRREIETSLRSSGIPTTDDNILRVYQKGVFDKIGKRSPGTFGKNRVGK